MLPEQIKAKLASEFPDCDIQVGGDGSHFDIEIIGDVFAGQRAVKRQQMVYAVLNEWIADGSVHAVNMKTLTRDEAAG